ncbi:C6 transcription factor, putative [Talaromyces stipitatus ATCC 10500]|uniref:C6 transcription factor, putative n=1 Tax=Talaromyces stipitatus (strain ATCC 10500 / CBS 375.48 / QM 6759 / NRRL 1006) TaxID=441959 RepID=B8LXR2_TALSN|nr:C6 transcription factor, putative [Talaromyces stipitatus ATCC 10500]EED24563.1 C6 transcription factor, putative [Talaromyces stipitatus ATCC 10500]
MPRSPSQQEKAHLPRPAALACIECRRKHLKCDAKIPVCSRCHEAGFRCSYLKSKRGGKRKYSRPVTDPDVSDSSSVQHQQQQPSPQRQWMDTSPAATLIYLNQSRPTTAILSADLANPESVATSVTTANIRNLNTRPLVDVPVSTSTGHATGNADVIASSSPQSFCSLQEQRVTQDSDGVLRGPAEETLVELYYENFHRSHPVLVPKRLYDGGRRYPSYLSAVIQYIGSHYSVISAAPLRELAATELAQVTGSENSPQIVQGRLLYAIALHGNGEITEARNWLYEAIEMALAMGMNKKEQGNDLEAESMRRTWWELYVLDGYLTALDPRGPSSFRMSSISGDVEMPCEENVYAEGRVPLPLPSSRQELEARIFGEVDSEETTSLSSFTYRVDAIDLIARVLAVRDPNRAHRDKAQAVDNTLASWAHYLPSNKTDIVNAYGEIDEMLLQAHMMVQFAAILLHFPRSNLILDFCADPDANENTTNENLLCGPISHKLPPSSTRHIHGIKATEASKRLSNLFSICTSLQKHSPLLIFGLSLCGVVQCSTFIAHVRFDGAGKCLEQHRDRVRLLNGLLKSASETWPLSKVFHQKLRRVAAILFQVRPVATSVAAAPPVAAARHDGNRVASTEFNSAVGFAPHTNDLAFQMENAWMSIDGQFGSPELAPWVWG